MMKNNEDLKQFLSYIDILIDGKFDIKRKSLACKFRGSTNQRVIDVSQSLKNKKAVIASKYK